MGRKILRVLHIGGPPAKQAPGMVGDLDGVLGCEESLAKPRDWWKFVFIFCNSGMVPENQ